RPPGLLSTPPSPPSPLSVPRHAAVKATPEGCWGLLDMARRPPTTGRRSERRVGSPTEARRSPRAAAREHRWRSDSGECLQSRLRPRVTQGFPIAVGPLVLEVRKVGVLRREQTVFLGFGLRPRAGELFKCGRFTARPELHREHPDDSAVLKPTVRQLAEQPNDALVFPCVPAIVQAVIGTGPRGRTSLPGG